VIRVIRRDLLMRSVSERVIALVWRLSDGFVTAHGWLGFELGVART
jgi:hypothetical protein